MDINTFSEKLQSIIMKALQLATTRQNSEITTVHMFIAMFEDDTLDPLLRKLGVDKNDCMEISRNRLSRVATVDYIPKPIFNNKVNDSLTQALQWAEKNNETYL
ncbi:MAG: hypothetical protein II712_05605, partial [Erysipelotrichaceae bacterium]|nr:hypothetical protein [Erysipelotrichaceae bacterium]